MKFNFNGNPWPEATATSRQILLVMRLIAIILLASCIQVSAHVNAQSITYSKHNASLKELFRAIRKQTGYEFLYNDQMIDKKSRISASFDHTPLQEALKEIFEGEPLTYTIIGHTIVVKESPLPPAPVKEVIPPIRLTGHVTDSLGNPLIGVTIKTKAGGAGTVTDGEGNYAIQVPEDAILEISYVGYVTKDIPVDDKDVINVVLKSSVSALNQLVVVGYGREQVKYLTGAEATINTKQLPVASVARVDQMLQGQAAGVQVTSTTGAPGATTTIRVRGNNSITAGSEPLYVIDGIIGIGDLNTLNPADIASITVLKDVSSTAIYGSRGSNGVILITTKRGKPGKPRINLNVQHGWQWLPREIQMLNGTQYAQLLDDWETLQNLPVSYQNPNSIGKGTDWQKEITRVAPLTSLNLSMSGGGNLRYYISGNFFGQQGIILNSGIKRYQFRVNLDNQISRKIRVGSTINLAYTKINNATVSLAGPDGTGLSSALSTPPVVPVYNKDGSFASTNPYPGAVAPLNNPVAEATLPTNLTNSGAVQGNLYLIYNPIKELSFKSTLGVMANTDKNDQYLPGSLPYQVYTGDAGEASIGQSQGITWQNENTLNFTKSFDANNVLDVLGGFTYQKGVNDSLSAGAIRFVTDGNTFNNLATGDPQTRQIASGYSSWNMISYLGRINYRWKDRYLFTLSGRYDGSSRLGENNKYAFFPSGAFGWILSEEPFIQNTNLFSFLKLRVSYGEAGNQAVGIYQTLGTYTTTPFVSGNASAVALIPSRVANPDLKWETLTQLDVGLNAGFFNDRLRLDVDYYNSRTRDLLLNVQVPSQTGYTTMLENIGEVSNEGIEITVHSVNIDNGTFYWETTFDISSNKNKVISLGPKADVVTLKYNYGLQPVGILRVGYPIGSFYGAVAQGLWQSQKEIDDAGTMPGAKPGMRRYKDLSGDGLFSNVTDYAILGNGNPKFFGGLGNTIKYRGFSLNVFFQGNYGSKIFNGWTAFNGSSNPENNQYEEAVNRWTPTNTHTDFPAVGGDRSGGASELTPNSTWIYNGSYLRLKTLSVSYSIPLKTSKQSVIQNIDISLTGDNLWLLTKYKEGYDPEVNTFGTSSILRGYDYGAYPNYRSVTFGVNLGL